MLSIMINLIVYGILLFLNKAAHVTGKSAFLILSLYLMICLLNSVRFIDVEAFKFTTPYLINVFDDGVLCRNGGFVGMFIGTLIVKAIGKPGLIIFAVVTIIVLLLVILNTPVSQFLLKMYSVTENKHLQFAASFQTSLAPKQTRKLSGICTWLPCWFSQPHSLHLPPPEVNTPWCVEYLGLSFPCYTLLPCSVSSSWTA